ncbi:MAG: hypothetical protein EOP06_10015 [Proteobacteria bacterium]|nr:MAG: hypothetical protein EOP06_10015 [Pseudomonadota bacterium]
MIQKILGGSVRFFIKAILIFSLVAFLVCIFVFTRSYPEMFSIRELVWFPVGAGVCCGLYFLWKWLVKKSSAFTIVFLSTLSMVVYAIVLLTFNTVPVSDYGMIWKTANEMAAGTFNAHELKGSDYIIAYDYLIGISSFESMLIRTFGPNFWVLKVVTCLCLLLVSYLVYKMARTKTTEESARAAYILSALFLPYIMTAGQFSNHHIGTIFLLLSLYYIDRKSMKDAALAGFFISVLNFFRPIAPIVLLATVCLCVYKMIADGEIAHELRQLAIIVITYLATTAVYDTLFVTVDYAIDPVSTSNVPYFKFHKGMSNYDEPWTMLNKFDGDLKAYNEWEKAEVRKIVTSPSTPVFVLNKMCRYLGLFDAQFEHTYNHDETVWQHYPIKAFYSIGWMQYIIYVCLALIGYIWWAKRNSIDIYQIWFIGNTLVYLFIEAITHYRFEHYIFLFLMAGCAFPLVRDRIARRRSGIVSNTA